MSAGMPAGRRQLAVNLLGVVEHATSGASPYAIGRDGRPYVPAGDGGLVLGVDLGEGVWERAADHVAPGACLVHPDPAARLALTGLSCLGNEAILRSGAAAGARGVVVGKRGEAGRVIVRFPPEVLATMAPGDEVSVRAEGQGHPPIGDVRVMNLAAELLEGLATRSAGTLRVPVRCEIASALMGNGIGRPAVQWCLDLQLDPLNAGLHGAARLALGDLVALDDVDARFNIGYRRGWSTVGVVVHGGSPLPGHGPGIVAVLTGPAAALELEVDAEAHRGLAGALGA
ncbi:MAG TPA: DUF4438 domain-containing protein [Acidimicrobiales bacterium]|nr:DUF4438 domain-containing protein [Acidimicrobiales bacterium]